MSLGEIIYMEKEAYERDQINWACSAQNAELLPKKKPSKHRPRTQVSAIFEGYYAKYGREKHGQGG